MRTCVRVSGFRYYLMLAGGDPADPGVFVVGTNHLAGGRSAIASSRPSRMLDGMRAFRILDIQAAPEDGNGAPWAREADGVWTVEPV